MRNLSHIFLVLCTIVMASASLSAQQDSAKYVIDFQDETLHQVFKRVQKELNIAYAYDVKSLRNHRVSVLVLADSEIEMNRQLLQETPFGFRKIGSTWVIYEKGQQAENRPDPTRKYITISGTVFDRATGQELPFTNVKVLSNDAIYFVADSATFRLDSIPTDTNTVLFSHLGYNSYLLRLNPAMALDKIEVRLSPSLESINRVEVTANRSVVFSISEEPGVQSIDISKALRIPNSGQPDLFNAAKLIPGVGSLGNNAAELRIRGGGRDENLVRLDGFTIFNPRHLDGIYSAFHPKSIADLTIYKSAYTAQLGGRGAGVIDAKTSNEIGEKPNLTFGINPISTDLLLSAPIVPNKVGAFVALRRSMSDFWENSIYQRQFNASYVSNLPDVLGKDADAFANGGNPLMRFYDLTAGVNYKPSRKDLIKLTLYSSVDYFRMQAEGCEENVIAFGDEMRWQNGGFGLNYTRNWDKWESHVFIGQSGFQNELNSFEHLDTGRVLSDQKSEISEQRFDLRLKRSIKKHELDFGLGYVGYDLSQDIFTQQDFRINREPDASELSLYAEDVVSFNRQWILSVGSRLTAYSAKLQQVDRQLYLEPRAHLRWKPTRDLNLKFAAGRHIQTMRQVQQENLPFNRAMAWLPADGSLIPLLDSRQVITGFTFFQKHVTVDMEAYVKDDRGALEIWRGYATINQNEPIFRFGDRRVTGVDLLLHKTGKIHSAMLAYTLGRIRHKYSSLENPAISSKDRLQELKVVYIKKFKYGQVTASFVYGSGSRYTGTGASGDLLVSGNAFDSRLKPIHHLDLSAYYEWKIKDLWTFSVTTSIHNVYNRQNELNRFFTPEGVPITGLSTGILPSLSLEVHF